MSQCNKLLEWFAKRKTITPMEAITDLKMIRLAARIHDLRKRGYMFHVEHVDGGHGAYGRFARYHFLGRGPE